MNYVRASYIGVLSMLAIVLLLSAQGAFAGQLDNHFVDVRYCGYPVKRDADGRIARRADVLRAFRSIHPCPSTGSKRGECPGWAMNHTIPLACGGCDSVSNLSWVPLVLKSGPGHLPIDRWERKVYCSPQVLVPMPAEPKRLMIGP